jgi:hypothetical protein
MRERDARLAPPSRADEYRKVSAARNYRYRAITTA